MQKDYILTHVLKGLDNLDDATKYLNNRINKTAKTLLYFGIGMVINNFITDYRIRKLEREKGEPYMK